MPSAATWMNLEIIILSEVNQRQIHDITYKCNLKNRYKLIYLQSRNRFTDINLTLWLPKGIAAVGER